MSKKSGARALRIWALIIFIVFFLIIGAVSAFGLKVYSDRQKDMLPELFGYNVASVGDSAMEPQISKGSAVIYAPTTESSFFYVDDILMLHEQDGHYPVKRLVAAEYTDGAFVYSLKGDADTEALSLGAADIFGKVSYSVPFLGYVIDLVSDFDGLVMLIAIPFAALLLIELILLIIAAAISKKHKANILTLPLLPDDNDENFVDVTAQYMNETPKPQSFLTEKEPEKFSSLDFNPLSGKEKEKEADPDEVESVTINTKDTFKSAPTMDKTLTMSVNGAEMAQMLLKKGQNFKIKVGEFTVNIDVE